MYLSLHEYSRLSDLWVVCCFLSISITSDETVNFCICWVVCHVHTSVVLIKVSKFGVAGFFLCLSLSFCLSLCLCLWSNPFHQYAYNFTKMCICRYTSRYSRLNDLWVVRHFLLVLISSQETVIFCICWGVCHVHTSTVLIKVSKFSVAGFFLCVSLSQSSFFLSVCLSFTHTYTWSFLLIRIQFYFIYIYIK